MEVRVKFNFNPKDEDINIENNWKSIEEFVVRLLEVGAESYGDINIENIALVAVDLDK